MPRLRQPDPLPEPTPPPPPSETLRRLRRDYRLAAVSQFTNLIKHHCALSFNIEELEADLQGAQPLTCIPTLLGKLLNTLANDRNVNATNWQVALRRQYNRRQPDDNPFQTLIKVPIPPTGPIEEGRDDVGSAGETKATSGHGTMTMDVDGNGDGDDKLKPSEPSELEHAAPSLDDKREGLPHSEALEATSGTTAPSAGIDVDEQQLEVSAEALVSSDTVPITPLVQTDSVDLKSESASDLKLPPSTSAQSAQVDHPMPLTTKEPPTASTSVLPEGEVAPLTDAAETSVATADENGTLSNLEKEDGTFYWDVLDIDWSEVDLETQIQALYNVCEWHMVDPDKMRRQLKWDVDASWRIEPIGFDSQKNAYFYLDDGRLWIRRAPPPGPKIPFVRVNVFVPPPIDDGREKKRRGRIPKEKVDKPKKRDKKGKGKAEYVTTRPRRRAAAGASVGNADGDDENEEDDGEWNEGGEEEQDGDDPTRRSNRSRRKDPSRLPSRHAKDQKRRQNESSNSRKRKAGSPPVPERQQPVNKRLRAAAVNGTASRRRASRTSALAGAEGDGEGWEEIPEDLLKEWGVNKDEDSDEWKPSDDSEDDFGAESDSSDLTSLENEYDEEDDPEEEEEEDEGDREEGEDEGHQVEQEEVGGSENNGEVEGEPEARTVTGVRNGEKGKLSSAPWTMELEDESSRFPGGGPSSVNGEAAEDDKPADFKEDCSEVKEEDGGDSDHRLGLGRDGAGVGGVGPKGEDKEEGPVDPRMRWERDFDAARERVLRREKEDGIYEWEVECITMDDWRSFAARFETSKDRQERALYRLVTNEILPILEEQHAALERERQAELILLSRKRSSRIALLESAAEEEARIAAQQAEAISRASRASRHKVVTNPGTEDGSASESGTAPSSVAGGSFNRGESREERLRKREEERLAREAAAEKAAIEESQRLAREAAIAANGGVVPPGWETPEELEAMRVTEEKAKKEKEKEEKEAAKRAATNKLRAERRAERKAAAALAETQAAEEDESWYLDCEICHKAGWNLDDGAEVMSCDQCDEWQHLPCHIEANEASGLPPVDYDTAPFVCRQCKADPSRKPKQRPPPAPMPRTTTPAQAPSLKKKNSASKTVSLKGASNTSKAPNAPAKSSPLKPRPGTPSTGSKPTSVARRPPKPRGKPKDEEPLFVEDSKEGSKSKPLTTSTSSTSASAAAPMNSASPKSVAAKPDTTARLPGPGEPQLDYQGLLTLVKANPALIAQLPKEYQDHFNTLLQIQPSPPLIASGASSSAMDATSPAQRGEANGV